MTLFLPEIVLLGMTTLFLFLSLAKNAVKPATLRKIMLAACLLLLGGCFYSLKSSGALFQNTYVVDTLSQGFKTLIGLGLFFTALLSHNLLSIPKNRTAEYYVF